jgi:hypothetical protein
VDTARRIAALRRQIEEANHGQPEDFKAWRQRTYAALRAVMGADHPLLASFDKVSYSPFMFTDSTPDSVFTNAQIGGVRSVIAILEGAIHEIELSEPSAPRIDMASLHPWIAGAAAGLWDDGHHRQAVDEATRAIEIRLKAKTGLQLTGVPLVTAAFNPARPKAGERRLRWDGFQEGTPGWTNAHEGAMAFARGCMLRIRNLAEHEDTWDEGEALESLAALSLLARWIDSARIVEGD